MDPKTVLVADDEPHMRRLLQFTLEKIGVRVELAANGREALAKLQRGPVHLLIIDMVMPDLDGLATVRELRREEQFRALPVIMLTSRGQSELKLAATETGVNVYLTKPFSPIELSKTVRQLVGLEPAK